MTTVLVVDDDPDFVEITRMILAAEGYAVETAANGEEAMRTLRESPPQLLLLDVMMAGPLDGVNLAHRIEEDEALHGIPILMISSITDSPMAPMFPTDEYLPVDGWISKPVQPDQLLSRVRRLIGKPS
jgi:CheY-like chemotaxis protein